jgi:SAM-dependent methyltransferase
MKPKPSKRELDPMRLANALMPRLQDRTAGKGELLFPAVPSLVPHYHQVIVELFARLSRPPSLETSQALRGQLEHWARWGWEQSPFCRVVFSWETNDHQGVDYRVQVAVVTVSEEYSHWRAKAGGDLFGDRPDSKVMVTAQTLAAALPLSILDVGAGEGRNTLALLHAGFTVDAVEPSGELLGRLGERCTSEGLTCRLFAGHVEQAELGIPEGHYDLLVLSEVVSTHMRTEEDLRRLLTATRPLLKPTGRLLLDVFLPLDGYKPQPVVRETAQCQWCCLFSRGEFERAMLDSGLERIEEVSALGWERSHLPPEQWPPTPWFEQWASGGNVFALPADRSPIELRWVLARPKS